MAGQVSPGIVLKERDLTTSVIVNQQANTAALVGNFEKGPVGTITSVSTEKEFIDIFGKPSNSNYEDWFVAQTFLSYGGQLLIGRVQASTLKNATDAVASGSTSDATKLLVTSAVGFTSGDLVKSGNEFFLVDTVTDLNPGQDTLAVTRAQLGSVEADLASGAVVTKFNFVDSATTTVVNETIDATETIIDLTSATSFTVGSYFRLTNSGVGSNAANEIVQITAVDGDQVVVTRARFGTTAVAQPGATITATLITWGPTATTTTLSAAYPVVTAGVTAPLIKSVDDFEANQSGYTFKFAAKTAGTWANNLKVVTIDGTVGSYSTQVASGSTLWSTIAGAPPTTDSIHVAVFDSANTLLESFTYASKISGSVDEQGASNYYVDVVNRKSTQVYAGSAVSAGLQSHTLAGGVDGYSAVVSEIQTAYDLFVDVEDISIDFILAAGSLGIESDQVSKAQKAISIASSRRDCITFVSPHKGFINLPSTSAQRDDIIAFFDSVGNSTSYAVFDSGYKYTYDRFNDTYRYIPCCGDVAGLCVETSANSEDWFSPAGNSRGNLRGVVKLAYVPTKTDRDKLYQARINPISSFPGQGTVLFGDKTALGSPSAFDRINVRRLFLAVEKRIGQLAKNVLFELNDASTRNYFTTSAVSYLAEVQAKRGVTDYLVVCDDTNNTADVIDRNEFVAEIYLKPSRSINYITLTFVATRTGVTFAEVTGR